MPGISTNGPSPVISPSNLPKLGLDLTQIQNRASDAAKEWMGRLPDFMDPDSSFMAANDHYASRALITGMTGNVVLAAWYQGLAQLNQKTWSVMQMTLPLLFDGKIPSQHQ